ncbi:MAG: DUF4337 domain-containing protein [Phycisphaerae bacterium]
MSEDNPTEQVHDDIHEHAHHAKERWIGWAALTAALIAALAAITGSLAGSHLTAASRNQIAANDQWGYYQAKGIKAALAETRREILQTQLELTQGRTAADPAAAGGAVAAIAQKMQAAEAKIKRYEEEQKETFEKAEALDKGSEHQGEISEILERGVTLFHIGIAVVAIAVLTKRRTFWVVSMGFAAVGVYFLVQGLMLHG